MCKLKDSSYNSTEIKQENAITSYMGCYTDGGEDEGEKMITMS